MTTIRNKTPGAVTGAKDFAPIPKYNGHLYAGYRLGTSYHGAGKLDGTSVKDLSGNGRDLTISGSGLGATSLAANGSSNFATLPFSTRDLAQVSGEMTFIAIATTLATNRSPVIGNLYNSQTNRGESVQLSMQNGSTTEGVIHAYNHPTGLSDTRIVSTVARDPTLFEMMALVCRRDSLMLYRRRAPMTEAEVAWRMFDVYINSADAILLGRTADGTFQTNGSNIIAADLCSAALTIDELDAAYFENQALQVALGGPAI